MMILKLALLMSALAFTSAAPTGKCNSVVECLFNRLQKEADGGEPSPVTKPPPCKRMLSRHGKRSVEEVECEGEPSSAEKRIFIESKDPEIRGIPEDEHANKLGSELEILKEKLRDLEDAENSETTTETPKPVKDHKTTEDVRSVLKDIEDDIAEIMPLLPTAEHPSNLQELRQLSEKLAAEDKKRSQTTTESPSSKQTDVPSTPKSKEMANADIEELSRLVHNLIEVDRIAYKDLQNQIDDLKRSTK